MVKNAKNCLDDVFYSYRLFLEGPLDEYTRTSVNTQIRLIREF